jgi:Flp pilus assembly protein protease CpaA
VTDPIIIALLVAGLSWASWVDFQTGRIPNADTFGMMAAGLLLHAAMREPLFALYGIGIAFAIHYPLSAFGVEKPGDAKLIMGVGALLGWREALDTSLWFAILYLPVGLAVLAIRGRLPNLLAVGRYQLDKARGVPVGTPPEPTPLRTAPVIAVATLIASFTQIIPIGAN